MIEPGGLTGMGERMMRLAPDAVPTGPIPRSAYMDRQADVLGNHPYVIIGEWETNPSSRDKVKMEKMKAQLELWDEFDPRVDDDGMVAREAIKQLLLRLDKLLPQTKEAKQGTDTVRRFLIDVRGFEQSRVEQMVSTPEGAKEIARILFDEMINQVQIIQDSDKIYIGADISEWKFDIKPGESTTLKALGESLKSFGPNHEAVGNEFLTDLFAVRKLFILTAGLEAVQKIAKTTAEYLDQVKIHLTDGQRKRILAVMGKEYADDGERSFAQDIHHTLVMYEALCAPTITTVETKETHEAGESSVIRNYKVRSKYGPFPQSISNNIKARYAIRRALFAIHSPTNPLGAQLRTVLANEDITAKRTELKTLLEREIESSSPAGDLDNKFRGLEDPGLPQTQSQEKFNTFESKQVWFAELMAMNYLEGNVFSAEYDAGQIKKIGDTPVLGKHGYPVIDRFGGCAATYKFAVVANAKAGMDKYAIEGEAERGDPGPPIIRNILVSTLLPLDEYLIIEELPRPRNKLRAGTLREAIFNAKDASEMEKAFASSVISLTNADEQVTGAVHEGWSFWQMFVKGMEIKFASIVHVAPWSEGLELEVDPSVEQKLKSVSSGIEYWLFRDNLKLTTYIKGSIQREFEDSNVDWKREFQKYRAFETKVQTARNAGETTVAINAIISTLGYSADLVSKYKHLYNKFNRSPFRDAEFAEGWIKGKPGHDDEYYARFWHRFFTRIFGIDKEEAKRGAYGKFVKELFSVEHQDWIRTTKKLVLGLLIIGQIQLNKEAANITPNDVTAIKAALNFDSWKHGRNRLSIKILRKIRNIKEEADFTGVGLFDQNEINAIIEDAGVPHGIFVQAEEAWKRVQQIQSGGSGTAGGKH